jgi:LacI family transcriptional regulator
MTTIKDVARLAGVGVGTASRVISGKGSFSRDAALRVEAAARQLGFRPSAIARALSLQSTGTIGVFVSDFKSPFYGPLLNAVDAELRAQGRHMVAANGCGGGDDPRRQSIDAVRFLIDRECDGVIICSNLLRDADVLQLREEFPQIAMVNRDVKGMKHQCFTVDHRAAGRIAADALLAHGHRRIAVISGPDVGDNRQRLQGLAERLAEDGVDIAAIPVEAGDFGAPSGWDAAGRLLARKPDITAVFCANDQMAMGAISHLQRHGVSVPGTWSVVGYDDADIAAWLSPGLTSVHIPIAEMGLNACRLLINLRHDAGLPVVRKFNPAMVMRDSLAQASG